MSDIVRVGATGLDLVHLLLAFAALVLGFLLMRARQARALDVQRLNLELGNARGDITEASARAIALEQQARTAEARARESELGLAQALARSEGDEHRFADLAQTVMQRANQQFLQLANETFEKHKEGAAGQLNELITPIRTNLETFSQKVAEIEKERVTDKSTLQEQVKAISENLKQNATETSRLVHALSTPKGGGRWGELSLRNVLEQAGLSAHCDFSEQVSTTSEDGRHRPDAILHLPGGRNIIIDAKVSIDAYLEASNADDPARRDAAMKAHAASVTRHVQQLSSKEYQARLGDSFDFVVMFIPGESMFAAALEYAPDLIQKSMSRNIIVTTPTTLIALALTVAHSWRQHAMSANAMEAAELGAELYTRMRKMLEHMEKLGRSLNSSVDTFNALLGSVDRKVLPQLRRFEDLSIAPPDKSLPELTTIDARARTADTAATAATLAPQLNFEPDRPDVKETARRK